MQNKQKSDSCESDLLGLLLLEDGHFFLGHSFGFSNQICIDVNGFLAADVSRLCGELCFNTSMAGYQEVLSDPSYAGQMICFSFPHIGNVGCNAEDNECVVPKALAMISREYPTNPSNWRSGKTLQQWLEKHHISGISGIDTRALIIYLRQHGSKRALLGTLEQNLFDDNELKSKAITMLLRHLQDSPVMSGQNVVSQISRYPVGKYHGSLFLEWLPLEQKNLLQTPDIDKECARIANLHVVVLDFGIKENILRSLKHFVTTVTVLSYESSWEKIVALQPDGLFLSNGPGDPEPVYHKIAVILEQAFAARLPIFGICLGHQILALSLGAKTIHMHHGHRGSNHPVLNILRNEVEITSQNHGFCIEESSLPEDVEITHRSLFDFCIEGIRSRKYPAFSVQYHPESSPGPHDSVYLFDDFIRLMEKCEWLLSN